MRQRIRRKLFSPILGVAIAAAALVTPTGTGIAQANTF
jgi:hypothetical protein